MLFDFDKFIEIIAQMYSDVDNDDLLRYLRVFQCYFDTYEQFIGKPHPPIRREQIHRIMTNMFTISNPIDPENEYLIIDEDCYPSMIQKHFKTKYRRCDYNINHFFSGRIRDYRYLETCYYGSDDE